MDFIQGNFFAYVAAWFSTMAGIWALFDRAGLVLKEEVKKQLTAWLKKDKSFDSKKWPILFISVFDRIFGEKHFSFKCFFRSCASSIFFLVIVTLLYLYLIDRYAFEVFFGKDRLLAIICCTLFINIIPDYFSLLETRFILKFMTKGSFLKKILLLCIDFLVTTIITLLGYLIFIITFSILFEESISEGIEVVMSSIYDSLFKGNTEPNSIYIIWLLTAYFTSIWLWLFFLSSVLIRFFRVFLKGLKILPKVFNIEEKPLRTMGFVCMILITLLFVIIPIF